MAHNLWRVVSTSVDSILMLNNCTAVAAPSNSAILASIALNLFHYLELFYSKLTSIPSFSLMCVRCEAVIAIWAQGKRHESSP